MKLKFFLIAILVLPLTQCSITQDAVVTTEVNMAETSPKLVVGIVIDQMRYDYINKYWEDYSEGGFKRLVREGFNCQNHHYSYAPTYTGPGHASIYTGTTPTNHGVIANDWYDKNSKAMVYCAKDTNYTTIGTGSLEGQMSTHRMISSTITDELKLFTNLRAKTVGISIKDRGAVLPAGHLADAAFWFEGGLEGKWISSSRYMDKLPKWATDFNAKNLPEEYLNKGWELLLDKDKYDESGPDNVPYESPFTGNLSVKMPYDLKKLAPQNLNYSILKSTPHGNTLTTLFTMAAIKGEEMGKDDITDFLAVSYSSPDYGGHKFGPQSLEIQDMYLRLDLEMESLLNFLDKEIGKGQYTVFLTADHGVVEIPSLMEDLGMPVKNIVPANIEDAVKDALMKKYKFPNLIENFSNGQFFLNNSFIKKNKLDYEGICNDVVDVCLQFEGIHRAFPSEYMLESEFTEGVMGMIQKGYNQKRSGDVLVVPKPGWLMTSYPQGTSHGSPYAYDTHVPFILFGNGVKAGESFKKSNVEDIAPTIAALLGIQMPNGCTGTAFVPALK